MPSLRGHHLICLHFFDGEGYSHDFTTNLEQRLKEIADHGADICSGVDDICRNCPYLNNSSCQYTENADKEINEMDAAALRLLGLASGRRVNWNSITIKLPQIFAEWHATFCQECSWEKVCSKNRHFRELKGR